MPRSGLGSLSGEDYLDERERAHESQTKQQQLKERGLTPDWFEDQRELCLPEGLKIAVIGGGFSGLAAGWYLKQCGAGVTVFEASDRAGGRVLTDRTSIPGKVLEAGAELIGENHPLWWILAKAFGLNLKELTDEKSYPSTQKVRMRFGSHDLSPGEKETLEEDLLRTWHRIGEQATTVSETAPWEHPEAAHLDSTSIADGVGRLIPATSSNLRQWFQFTLGNDNCAPIETQSYLGLLASVSAARMGTSKRGMLGYWLSTETHRCQGGNDRLSQRLSRFVGVRTGSRVRSVLVNRFPGFPPVVVASEERRGGMPVAARVEGFHYAVLTAPPSVWPAIRFYPSFPFPDRTILHGPAVKFLTRYPTPFWREEGYAPVAKWNELGSVWEGTDQQNEEIPGFALSVFSGGPFVFAPGKYPTQLTALYPGRRAHLRGEEFVDWPSKPFIETGYAVPAKGQASTVNPALMRPHAGRLFFAGEQASPGFFGYMEGALQAGARAARDIVLDAAIPCARTMTAESAPGGSGGDFGGAGASGGW
ncbi:MAG TPA: NAD(P)/FAD-dependent oxidoreductase [Solirubrobacterales bacterium]|nr:NAD(P)/FAD-dependent oxidoreductase [Solirubrobacterales bacterium]